MKKIAKVLAVLMVLSMLLTACTPKVAEPAAPAEDATAQEATTVVSSDKTAGLMLFSFFNSTAHFSAASCASL